MKPHVQACFKMPFDAASVSAAKNLVSGICKSNEAIDLEKLPDDLFDAITEELRSEFVVEVVRSGDGSLKAQDRVQMRVKSNDVIRAQIREWMQLKEQYNADAISLEKHEVLVVVRAECCALTSSGQACPH